MTALSAWLQARSAGGKWLLRMDDLDPERCRIEYADIILRQLDAHGLEWDESVRLQSHHLCEYQEAFLQLQRRASLYVCTCSRARLREQSKPGIDGPIYCGACRIRQDTGSEGAWRLKVGTGSIAVNDAGLGRIDRNLQEQVGDFIVRRADGQIGYQLACVVDEIAQGVTEVVRGADLIGSTVRQRYLQKLLDIAPPGYRHMPLLLDTDGRKLSKQNHAAPLKNTDAAINLLQCLHLLGQDPPENLRSERVPAVLSWALTQWDPDRVGRQFVTQQSINW